MARKPLFTPGSILPATDTPPPPPDDLLSRIVANDRAKRQAASAENPAPYQPADHTTGNATGHTSGNTANQTENITNSNTTSNIKRNTISPTQTAASRVITQQDTEAKPLSLAEQIRQNARNARSARAVPLKLVTLKVPPDLDDRVEAHCQQSGRKKQDVIRDALRLYLEVVEQTGEEEEGDVRC